ncbi:MAG: DUF3578 domain-containing protein [Rhodovulum sp.]|nr:DUF3578 domain-containing protein [Rhodovulum sp.]|tara:strand:+ start:399 stop:1376 length:978 start_codon:yes stop_codon:yes gene_type:complete
MLAEYLARLAMQYVFERAKPFAGSAFANFVRHDIAVEAKKTIALWPYDLTLKASVGQGNWASVPWLAFFHPLITRSATEGFYVVFLINPIAETITLSMNQATTAVYNEHGERRGRDVLRRRAKDMAERVGDMAGRFNRDPISLGSDMGYPLGYEAGHAFGKTYTPQSIIDADLTGDLRALLDAYQALILRGGLTPLDVMQDEAGSQDIEEVRRYTLSRRIERAPDVRKKVLASKTLVCEGCKLDPVLDYGYSGKPVNTPLDVHHAKPLDGLAEGEQRLYRIPDDFLLLCPTCHRMIHKQDDPADLKQLQRSIRFRHMREVLYPTT